MLLDETMEFPGILCVYVINMVSLSISVDFGEQFFQRFNINFKTMYSIVNWHSVCVMGVYFQLFVAVTYWIAVPLDQVLSSTHLD